MTTRETIADQLGFTDGYQLVRAYSRVNFLPLSPMIYYREQVYGPGRAKCAGYVTFCPAHWLFLEPEHDKFTPVWLHEDKEPVKLVCMAEASRRYETEIDWVLLALKDGGYWIPRAARNWVRRELASFQRGDGCFRTRVSLAKAG